MVHLRVELHPIIAARTDRPWPLPVNCRCRASALKSSGQAFDPVAVRHPHRGTGRWQQRVGSKWSRPGLGRTPAPWKAPHATQCIGQRLHAVTNAQHRHPGFQHIILDVGSVWLIDRGWPAGQDVALGLDGLHFFSRRIPREQLAIDMASRTLRAINCEYWEPKSRTAMESV